MTLEEIVNNLKSAGQDYGQLFNNNPRMDNFASVLQQGLGQLIPSNADFKSPEAMRDWGTAAALNGPMGLTFTGPKSMGWNHDAANTATKLLDNGADPAQVWKDHLIGRMPDKSLFSEIDDSLAKISDIKKGFSNKNIEDVISHPELMNNYNLTTKIDHIPKEYSFHPEQNKITIGSIPLESGDPDLLLHEFQHAIQSKEGWPQGGNPEMLHKEYIQGIKYGDKEATKKLYGKLLSWDDAYNRLTGEAQARATQDRMNMNMQQRRDTYPLAGDKLSDIPLDQLINRYGDNGPSMSMSIKNPNLNAGLLDKHLSGQKLTPEEMALYEKNGSAMETPQLQRYNLGNANAQGGSPKARARSDGFETAPKKELYHSAKTDWESNIVDPSKSDLGFHLGSLDQASYRAKVFDGGLGLDAPIGGNIIPITKSKYAITLPLKDEGAFRPDVVGLQLEKKKMLDKGYVNKMEADPLNSSDYWKWNDVYAEKMRDVLKQNDYHGAHYENAQEGPGKSFVITDPSIIRSRFAAFDPLRKNSSSLLASGLLGSLLLKQMNQESSQQ